MGKFIFKLKEYDRVVLEDGTKLKVVFSKTCDGCHFQGKKRKRCIRKPHELDLTGDCSPTNHLHPTDSWIFKEDIECL